MGKVYYILTEEGNKIIIIELFVSISREHDIKVIQAIVCFLYLLITIIITKIKLTTQKIIKWNENRICVPYKIDFSTDTTIALAVLGVVKVLKQASSIKHRSQLIAASLLNAKIYIAF